MSIVWKPEYSVEIDLIDEQHKHFIELINDIEVAIEKKEDEAISIVISNLLDYAMVHFETEESLFKKFNYEHSLEHIKIHEAFKKRANGFMLEFKNQGAQITGELHKFMGNWLINHIMKVDKEYAKCFHEHGLK